MRGFFPYRVTVQVPNIVYVGIILHKYWSPIMARQIGTRMWQTNDSKNKNTFVTDNKSINKLMNMLLSKIDARLERLTKPHDWIGVKEAARYCGLSVSTIRRAVRVGSLKCSRRSQKMLFKRKDLDRWLYD